VRRLAGVVPKDFVVSFAYVWGREEAGWGSLGTSLSCDLFFEHKLAARYTVFVWLWEVADSNWLGPTQIQS
jgi:hypothetical protein